MSPWVWERKYEIDSLCYPIELAYRLWRITGRADVIDERFRAAADAILELWTVEQDHEAQVAVPVPAARRRADGHARPGGTWAATAADRDVVERFPAQRRRHRARVQRARRTCSRRWCSAYLQAIATEVLARRALADAGEGAEGRHRRRDRPARHGRAPDARPRLRLRGGRRGASVADGRREHAEPAVAADDRVRRRRRPDVPGDPPAAAQPREPLLLQRHARGRGRQPAHAAVPRLADRAGGAGPDQHVGGGAAATAGAPPRHDRRHRPDARVASTSTTRPSSPASGSPGPTRCSASWPWPTPATPGIR